MTDREKLFEILNQLDVVNHPYEAGEIAQVAESCFNDLYEYLEIEKQNKKKLEEVNEKRKIKTNS